MTQPVGPYTVSTPALQGPPGPVAPSVASTTLLSATADGAFLDGALAFVTTSGARALWRLDRTTSLSVDGVTVVATQSGNGKWVLNSRYSGRVPATEVGVVGNGVADDSSAINTALPALTTANCVMVFSGLTCLCQAAGITVPANAKMEGFGSTLKANLSTGTVTASTCLLFCSDTLSLTTFSLHANVTQGSTSVQVTGSSFVVGNKILVQDGDCAAKYTVQAVTNNSGFQTLTIDRGTLWPFTSATGNARQVTAETSNAQVRGFTLIGTCQRYVHVQASNFLMEDITATDTSGFASDVTYTGGPLCFDTGSFQCKANRLTVQGLHGFCFHAAEDCTVRDYTFRGHGTLSNYCPGLNFSTGAACNAYDVDISGAVDGIMMHGNGTTPVYTDGHLAGSSTCCVTGGAIMGCTGSGSYSGGCGVHTDQCDAPSFVNLTITGNNTGLNINDATFSPCLRGISATNNVGAALIVASPTIEVDGIDVSSVNKDATNTSGIYITNLNPGVTTTRYVIRGLHAGYSNSGGYVVNANDGGFGASVTIDGFDVAGIMITQGGSPSLTVKNGVITANAGNSALNCLATSNGQMFIENVVATAGAGTNSISSTGNTTVWVGPNVTFGATATPLSIGGNCFAVQSGEYNGSTLTGTTTLSLLQAQSSSIKLTGSLSGNVTYNIPAGVQGLKYVVDASGVTLNGHTLNFGPPSGTVSLTAAQHVVYSDGTNAHTVV